MSRLRAPGAAVTVRRASSWIASFTMLALAAAAAAQDSFPAMVNIEAVRSLGGDRQRAWVSVLDGEGAPVRDLPARAFEVLHDGRAVGGLEVEPVERVFAAVELTLLVDDDLLRGAGGSRVGDVLERLSPGADPRTTVRVVSTSGRGRELEAPLARAGELRGRLGEVGGDGDGRLYDALYDAVRRGVRGGDREGALVLLLTHGADPGSRRGVLEVLALQGLNGRVVPVMIVALDPGSGVAEGEKLLRLAARSAGAYAVTADPGAVPALAARMLGRFRGLYRLAYEIRVPARGDERHVLEVKVTSGGAVRTGRREYLADDVEPPAWWRQPLPWVILGTLAVLGLGAYLLLRPRRLCRLVVTAGEERGCSYDILAMPVALGAAQGNDIILAEPRVSRSHAVLERRASLIELVDLNSENGTFVNGDRVTRRRLADGDRLRFGDAVELKFEGRSA